MKLFIHLLYHYVPDRTIPCPFFFCAYSLSISMMLQCTTPFGICNTVCNIKRPILACNYYKLLWSHARHHDIIIVITDDVRYVTQTSVFIHVLRTYVRTLRYVRTLVVAVWSVSMTCIYRFSPANSLTSFVLLSFCQCALCETEIKTYCFVISYTRNALELLINALSHDVRTLAHCSRCRPIRRMTTPYDFRSTYSWVVNSAADPDHLH